MMLRYEKRLNMRHYKDLANIGRLHLCPLLLGLQNTRCPGWHPRGRQSRLQQGADIRTKDWFHAEGEPWSRDP